MTKSHINPSRKVILLTISALLMSGLWSCGSPKMAGKPTASSSSTPISRPDKNTTVIETGTNLRLDQKKLVDEAMTWLGVPYRYGGKDRSGADCSGLTMMVYKSALDIKIPRNSAEQQRFCATISQSQLEVGDLVFFCTGRDKNRVSHVGIYLGDSRFIHASSSKGVVISSISDNYFTRTYHSSGHVRRRYEPQLPQPAPETQPMQFEFDEAELDRAIESRIDSISQVTLIELD